MKLTKRDKSVIAWALNMVAEEFTGTFSMQKPGLPNFIDPTPGRYHDGRDHFTGHLLQSHDRLTVQRYLRARAEQLSSSQERSE